MTHGSWESEQKGQVWCRSTSFQNLCSWSLHGYFPAQACLHSFKAISQHSSLCVRTPASSLPPTCRQVRLFPGCLVQRSTRNIIKRVRIPQEHIILLLGSAPDSSPAEAWPMASKPSRAGKQLLPWCPWVKEEQLPAFLLGQSFTEFKSMMGMIYILGF